MLAFARRFGLLRNLFPRSGLRACFSDSSFGRDRLGSASSPASGSVSNIASGVHVRAPFLSSSTPASSQLSTAAGRSKRRVARRRTGTKPKRAGIGAKRRVLGGRRRRQVHGRRKKPQAVVGAKKRRVRGAKRGQRRKKGRDATAIIFEVDAPRKAGSSRKTF